MDFLMNSPLFGILSSLLGFMIGTYIYRRTSMAVFNPILICIILLIAVLKKFNISLETYNQGGKFISFFLAPATIVLAVPLYRQKKLLVENIIPILTGILSGVITSVCMILFLGSLLNIEKTLVLSLVPKSITTPLGIALTQNIGGMESITIVAIIITGILGAIISPVLLKILKIQSPIAKGIGIGTSAHAVGTSKAVEMGETEGAMSGMSIGLAGLITVLLAPAILSLLNFL